MSSNYPPGVTGNEFEIAGPDYEQEYPTPCPKCGAEMLQQGYGYKHWVDCENDHQFDLNDDMEVIHEDS